jgi:hypothetical protein
MPHSPITRVLAALIVGAALFFLLHPSPEAHTWARNCLAALPVLAALFTWSAVRSAPPFDDRAFHRTLPPGDGFAFRRVVAIHLLVLAGIATAVVLYCWRVNFGWREMSYGILLLTLPLAGLMAAVAVAASLSTSRQHWKSVAWIAVFGVPLLSLGIVLWVNGEETIGSGGSHLLSRWRTSTLLAAGVYPLIWWLAAARRRRGWGIAFGAATGALMPWVMVFGDFLRADRDDAARYRQPLEAKVVVTRKPIDPKPDDELWIPVDEVIEVTGLEESEVLVAYDPFIRQVTGDTKFWRAFEARRGAREPATDRHVGTLYAMANLDGQIVWGEDVVWEHLRQRVPPHRRFVYPRPGLEKGTRLLFPRPVESVQSEILRKKRPPLSGFTEADIRESEWNFWVFTERLVKLGEADAAKGGTFRCPSGGIVRIDPWRSEDWADSLRLSMWMPGLDRDIVWPGVQSSPRWMHDIWIIALHPDGTAYAISGFEFNGGTGREPPKVFLGDFSSRVFEEVSDDSSRRGLAKVLHECRIHVFVGQHAGRLPHVLPPPK